MKFVFAIGSQHSGTRLLTRLLYSSHFFMYWVHYTGESSNDWPLQHLVSLSLEYTQQTGTGSWNIDNLFNQPVPEMVYEKLGSTILKMTNFFEFDKVAIKYPDLLFFLPWVAEIMPNAYFLEIVRDPRDVIDGSYIHHPDSKSIVSDIDNPYLHHAYVLLYQFHIVKRFKEKFPTIKHLCVRHEDLISNHETTVEKIEWFLGTSLSRIPIDSSKAYKWINGQGNENLNYPFLQEILEAHNYQLNR